MGRAWKAGECCKNKRPIFGLFYPLENSQVPGYSATLPVAASKQGLAWGEVWTSRGGNPFSVWRGLRYAKPPIGDRRFRRPEPLAEEDSWEGERDFHEEMPRCYQLSVVPGFHMGQEDCLFLNVYTPVGNEELLPVMVYLHGGGFVAGVKHYVWAALFHGRGCAFGDGSVQDWHIWIPQYWAGGGTREPRFVGPARGTAVGSGQHCWLWW